MPTRTSLHLYGQRADVEPLEWSWVEAALAEAPTYWVVAASDGHPHPRPVWGVWLAESLHVSVGSPALNRALRADPNVTVHLDSGTDVVIVEGRVADAGAAAEVVSAYDTKYDWTYDAETYGPLLRITPGLVLAWRTAGWAGRESFQAGGRWQFGSDAG